MEFGMEFIDHCFMSSDLFLVQRQRDCHFMMWLLLCLLLIGFLDIKCHNTYKAVNKFYRSYILDLDIQCLKLNSIKHGCKYR